ncbi:hypothetical protein KKF82_07690 [Patescibacteria group bacterium]|nr:hypothetical protein [Patescibacteria group bacterium]
MKELKVSDKTKEIISRLDRSFKRQLERYDHSDHKECTAFQKVHGMEGWEIFFMLEEDNYEDCLSKLSPDDVVFDVGAGDMRFDLMVAGMCKKVYAVEINPGLVSSALRIIGWDMPANLTVICGNAFEMELPGDVTVVTCLMIHRQHEFPEQWKRCRIIYAMHDGIKECRSGTGKGEVEL